MNTGMKTADRPSPSKTLLLINADCCGHFLVYSNVLTGWALARGLRVLYLGPIVEDRSFVRLHAGHPRVQFLDAGLEPSGPETEPFSCRWIRQVQTRLRPDICVLLNGDALLFEEEELLDAGLRFPARTFAVSTFGHRERYTCFDEPYTTRLNALLSRPGPGLGPFAGLFTLDEHHARAARREGKGRLHFLPDMYRDFPAQPRRLRSAQDLDEERALHVFLESCQGPVLPLLGKFDGRKNPLWVLRLVAERPKACCVVLGERVPGPEDGEIDALLARLEAEGRAFVRFRYVSEALFDVVLRHPRTGIVPLPYHCHFGSSGIQLMACLRGRPVLVSDQGLMAARVRDWGLGRAFRVGDEADFRREYGRMEHEGAEAYAQGIRRFMRYFSRANLYAALDVMLDPEAPGARAPKTGPQQRGAVVRGLASGNGGKMGNGGGAASHSAKHATNDTADRATDRADQADAEAEALFRQGLDAAALGGLEKAVALMRASLALEPGAHHRQLRLALLLRRLGRLAEAHAAMLQVQAGNLSVEFGFVVRLSLDLVALMQLRGERQSALELLAQLLAITPGFPSQQAAPLFSLASGECLVLFRRSVHAAVECCALPARGWYFLADVLVQNKTWDLAAACYAKALELTPEDGGLALSLSDVLRYMARHDESLEVLDQLERRAPDSAGLWHKRGQVYLAQGRIDEALAAFAREPADSPFAEAVAEHVCRALAAQNKQ